MRRGRTPGGAGGRGGARTWAAVVCVGVLDVDLSALSRQDVVPPDGVLQAQLVVVRDRDVSVQNVCKIKPWFYLKYHTGLYTSKVN